MSSQLKSILYCTDSSFVLGVQHAVSLLVTYWKGVFSYQFRPVVNWPVVLLISIRCLSEAWWGHVIYPEVM